MLDNTEIFCKIAGEMGALIISCIVLMFFVFPFGVGICEIIRIYTENR